MDRVVDRYNERTKEWMSEYNYFIYLTNFSLFIDALFSLCFISSLTNQQRKYLANFLCVRARLLECQYIYWLGRKREKREKCERKIFAKAWEFKDFGRSTHFMTLDAFKVKIVSFQLIFNFSHFEPYTISNHSLKRHQRALHKKNTIWIMIFSARLPRSLSLSLAACVSFAFRLRLPDYIVPFVQDACARWCSWCRFVSLMVLRLWMQCQFIVFVIEFFIAAAAAAAFAVAMDDRAAVATAVRTVPTFWRRMTFLFLMYNRWHIFACCRCYNFDA